MAISREGKIYVLWQHFSERPYNTLARVYFASYDGNHWTAECPITDSLGAALAPDIAVDTLGRPQVVWIDALSDEISYQWCDGERWSIPVNVSQDSGASYYPQIATDSKNKVHIVWHDYTTGNWSIYYRSFDGSHWSAVRNLSDSLYDAGFPTIAVDGMDNIHVAFDCYTGPWPLDNYEIYYRTNAAGVWSGLVRLSNDSLQSQDAVVGVNPNGFPIIVWKQVVDNSVNPIIVRAFYSEFDGSSWTLPVSISDTSQSYGPLVAVDRFGGAHTTWLCWDANARTGQILYSSLKAGTWSVPVNIAGSTPGPTQSRLCVDSAGICHVVFVSEDNSIYYTHQTGSDGIALPRWDVPDRFSLEQNYPNPFNPTTGIRYQVSGNSWVRLVVYDLVGREVAVLVDAKQTPGEHELRFDGSALSSGVYFYRLTAGDFAATKAMILLR